MKNRNDPWHWNTKNNKKYNIMKLLITNDILTNNLINIIQLVISKKYFLNKIL